MMRGTEIQGCGKRETLLRLNAFGCHPTQGWPATRSRRRRVAGAHSLPRTRLCGQFVIRRAGSTLIGALTRCDSLILGGQIAAPNNTRGSDSHRNRPEMETCGRCCAAAPELTLQLSPFRPPPPRRPGLSLATEPALPFRVVDARPRVRLASRHVVDTHSFPVDVPLDAALAGIAPHYSFKPFPAAPAPRRHEVPSPHPATGGLRCGLLRNIIARILPVRERPPLRDHPRIHVLTSEAAHGDDSPVAVTVALLAGDRTSGDALAKRTGRRGTAGPRLTCNAAGLLRLRSINPMEVESAGRQSAGYRRQ